MCRKLELAIFINRCRAEKDFTLAIFRVTGTGTRFNGENFDNTIGYCRTFKFLVLWVNADTFWSVQVIITRLGCVILRHTTRADVDTRSGIVGHADLADFDI